MQEHPGVARSNRQSMLFRMLKLNEKKKHFMHPSLSSGRICDISGTAKGFMLKISLHLGMI